MTTLQMTRESDFVFWTPGHDEVVLVGPEQLPVPVPVLPLPILRAEYVAGERPSDDAIGRGIYDYLRRDPDAAGGPAMAELLRNAYPHYLADVASHVIMLDEKEVDAAYVQRKLTGMKLLALCEPRPQLLYLLGKTSFELGTMFTELADCRRHFLAAMSYLQRSLAAQPDNPAALNYLAQIDYWFGDYPAAARRWQGVVELLAEGPARQAVQARLTAVLAEVPSAQSLVDELEALGATLVLIGNAAWGEALTVLEQLEEAGRVTAELPMPEFYHLLGHCREQTGDLSGALVAYERALALDSEFPPALEGFARISGS